jgi:EAL domain-containing protein (putative c-di-GMP-specific phosphodiesterase class I)
LRFCIEIGADLAQGYFLAHPEKIAPTVSADALRVLEECSHMTNPVLL